VVVQSSPGDGHFVRRFRLPPFARIGDAWFVSLELGHDTPVYGLGEKWGRLDRRGQAGAFVTTTDALGVNAEVSYKNAPFAWSPEGWGAFVHTVAPVLHAVGLTRRGRSEPTRSRWIPPRSTWFLFGRCEWRAGHRPVHGAHRSGARATLWSLGLILSKAYYRHGRKRSLAVAREVRARGMPCDTITFDGRAWQDTDTRFAFEWDPARYPDPGPSSRS